MRAVFLLLVLIAWLPVASCASARTERVEAALLSDEPPKDFWIAATVMRPVPLGAIINARTNVDRPTVKQPARYIVEADAILRAAVGYGATEQTFPPETRQLTHAQHRDLWLALRDSPLVDPAHPNRVGRLPELDEFNRATEGRGGYCISYAIAGERRILAIDEASPAAPDARELVARLAELAWIPFKDPEASTPPTPPTSPVPAAEPTETPSTTPEATP